MNWNFANDLEFSQQGNKPPSRGLFKRKDYNRSKLSQVVPSGPKGSHVVPSGPKWSHGPLTPIPARGVYGSMSTTALLALIAEGMMVSLITGR